MYILDALHHLSMKMNTFIPSDMTNRFLIVISDTDLRKAWNYRKMINIGQSKSALFPEDFLITMSDRVSSRRINIVIATLATNINWTQSQAIKEISGVSIYIVLFNGYFSDLVIFLFLITCLIVYWPCYDIKIIGTGYIK